MSLLTDPTKETTLPTGTPPPGNQPPADWRASLPEELRSEKVFEAIKGKDWAEAGPVLAKNYVHAQRLVGADRLTVPTDTSTPEEIASFRTKIGVPAKPEEYKYNLPEGLKEDALDKTRMDAWRKELHEAGIPAKAAERIMSRYLNEEHTARVEAEKAAEKQEQTWVLEVKSHFGDKFDEAMNYARLALRDFGSPALTKALDDSGFGNHPEVIKAFTMIGRKLADDTARGTSGGTRPPGSPLSKESAQAELNAFNRDEGKQRALFDARHPQHANVVKERAELFKAAFPPDAE